jgi:hypothetical protein
MKKLVGYSVGLGVYAGGVEYLLAADDAEEACALGKRLITYSLYLF